MSTDSTLEDLATPLRDLQRRFIALTEPHRQDLWRYCLRLTGSPWDAEDLIQETVTRAFARVAHFFQPLDMRAYLFRIATNTWMDAWRRQRPEPYEDPDTLPGLAERPDPAPEPGVVWAAMEALVTALTPRQRVILLLVEVFGFRPAEVAGMVGSTEGAVKAALHRARVALEKQSGVPAPAQSPPAADPALRRLIDRFVEAFNRRDADAVLSLLDAEAVHDIVGVSEERGRDVIRRNSLAEGMADPEWSRAEAGTVAGRPAVLVYFGGPDGDERLGWVIALEAAEDRVVTMRSYYFTPEFLRHASGELGVPAVTHGYLYQGAVG
ncbi:MAG: sigma-70 family RNA polymerase sigma factor [Firmicutes bacterium]|nr:sigma-70 family RNA polymerase sigma factor [Bacillota bacterium]